MGTTSASHNPKVISDQKCDAIYVSWAEILRAERETEINPEIMLRWSLDGGQSFSTAFNISNNTSENSGIGIEMGLSEGQFSIAWMDKHSSSENEYQDIFYRAGKVVEE